MSAFAVSLLKRYRHRYLAGLLRIPLSPPNCQQKQEGKRSVAMIHAPAAAVKNTSIAAEDNDLESSSRKGILTAYLIKKGEVSLRMD